MIWDLEYSGNYRGFTVEINMKISSHNPMENLLILSIKTMEFEVFENPSSSVNIQ